MNRSINPVPSKPLLEVKQLAKSVPSPEGQLDILSGIEFSIFPAESLAIIGASGAGKSTLLGLLAGLDTPTGGEIYFQGENFFALDEDGRARVRGECMGFVFQSFQLLPTLTALENVMLPLELVGNGGAFDMASSVLERVGLADRMQHYPRQLSGGEQQRVAIARAFAVEPLILFADEPTGNLDSQTGAKIIDLLFNLNQEKQTTLVLVTHDESLAQRCGRRLVLGAGRMQEWV